MINEQTETDSYVLIVEPHILLPAIFVKNGRQQFRKVFIKSYPSFIHLLRISVPQVTSGEELLCMLIFLRQSTDDISAILGISRKSVNQSRYRLRLKINLPTHWTLEEFVYQLLPNSY